MKLENVNELNLKFKKSLFEDRVNMIQQVTNALFEHFGDMEFARTEANRIVEEAEFKYNEQYNAERRIQEQEVQNV